MPNGTSITNANCEKLHIVLEKLRISDQIWVIVVPAAPTRRSSTSHGTKTVSKLQVRVWSIASSTVLTRPCVDRIYFFQSLATSCQGRNSIPKSLCKMCLKSFLAPVHLNSSRKAFRGRYFNSNWHLAHTSSVFCTRWMGLRSKRCQVALKPIDITM